MNPINLAGLTKRVYPNFDMSNFSDRLKLQKLVYLMKASGINLGYSFRLYLHGPYCSLLARDGFDMPEIQECNEVIFEDKEKEEKFKKLISFLKEFKDDKDKMEILASLQFFRRLYPEKNEAEIISLVENKNPKFDGQKVKIKELFDELNLFIKKL
jgi:uncharacterized protein YwgA